MGPLEQEGYAGRHRHSTPRPAVSRNGQRRKSEEVRILKRRQTTMEKGFIVNKTGRKLGHKKEGGSAHY